MARRNLFQPPAPPAAPVESPLAEARRFPDTGTMTGMKSTLRDMSNNAVREIDPSLIEDDGPRDRLDFGPEAVAELAESIRVYGQQVPIMVRPLRDKPGRYQVVYGRRRLAALRHLGQVARAMVRTLDDTQAILAQGQENSQRLDPSFIEKAVFATQLADDGHEQAVILDALAIDKPMLSRMHKVGRSLPVEWIEAIGPAHGVGRRRWEEMADFARAAKLDYATLLRNVVDRFSVLSSDERFDLAWQVMNNVPARAAKTVPAAMTATLSLEDGRALAELKATPRSLTLKINAKADPEFVSWLSENAETCLRDLYRSWAENK